MGGGSGETPQYRPQLSSQYGLNIPQIDYGAMQNRIASGQLYGGGRVPQYRPQTPYNFTTPDISKIPHEAYQNVLNRGVDDIQMQQQMFGAQAARNMGGRGYSQGSGYLGGQQADIARQALMQGAQMTSNLGLEEARSQLDVDKLMGQWGMDTQARQAAEGQFVAGLQQWLQSQQAAEALARSGLSLQAQQAFEASRQFGAGLTQAQQQAQAAERLARSGLDLQAQTQLSDLLLRQAGGMATLGQQSSQQAMLPYTMLAQLYGQNLGVPFQVTQGKGSPLSALLNAGAG